MIADKRLERVAATKVAFAFTGEGSEWVGMGQELYDSEPVVRAVLDRCDAVLREERGASLLDAMFGRAEGAEWTRPAVYALECALTALWASVGIQPSAVVGQGLGELAAAQAAGVFGLEEGLRFAAAADGPEDIAVAPPSLAFVSGVTGRVMEGEDALDAAYWQRQAREPVAFDRCVETLAELGVQVVVELGPDTVLGPTVVSAWPESADVVPVVLSSQGDDGFVGAVAGAYEAGLTISFAGLFAGETRRRISLPSYPFQRRRHWIEMRPAASVE